MQKTRQQRTPKARIRSKGISLEIRCKANILPFKTLLYAIAFASKNLIKPRNSNANLYGHRLASQLKDIGVIATSLRNSTDVDPESQSIGMESAVRTYVELFYTLSKAERESYLRMFGRKKSKVSPERNLLIAPALMAEVKCPKEQVSRELFGFLYRMPFKVLCESSKSALNVALFQQNLAIRTMPYDTVQSLSKSMESMEQKMRDVQEGRINPNEDEALKAEFIDKAAGFSKETDINIMDIMSEMVGTESAMRARMQRIIRRQRY